MTQITGNRRYGIGVATLLAVGLLLLGSVIVMWSWNAVAAELFLAPAMKYKHAVAAELFVATIAATFGMAWLLSTGRRRSHEEMGRE